MAEDEVRGKVEKASDYPTSVGRWLAEIRAYDDAFSDWKKKSTLIQARYRNEQASAQQDVDINTPGRRFSVLWSNIQTLLPAMYSKEPEPDVTRRYRDNDQIARVGAVILERCARDQVANGFDGGMRSAVLDYLLTGRGQMWVRYEPTFSHEEKIDRVMLTENPRKDRRYKRSFTREGDDTVYGEKDVQFDEQQQPYLPMPYREVVEERVEFDHIQWQHFGHTPAPNWRKVRAVWKTEYLTREQCIERFGQKIGSKIGLTKTVGKTGDANENKWKDVFQRAEVHEIWDKPSKKVIWVSPGYTEGVLDEIDDPLHLDGFFPCPEPIIGTHTTDSLVPVPDYEEYRVQAEQIDQLSGRINVLTKALKVAGAYNGAFKDLENILDAPDNILIPVKDWGQFSEKGGVAGAISFVPIKEVAETVQLLMQIRDQMKRDLFELTGLSDIIRGQATGNAATATEQRIKGQYAGLRLEDRQRQIAQFAAGCVKLMAEIVAEHFGDESLRLISDWENSDEFRQIAKAYEEATQPQQNPQPAAPPQAPAGGAGPVSSPVPVPPTNSMPMMMAQPDLPPHPDEVFMQAVQLLRDEKLRGYNIEVSTDSLVLEDRQLEKEARTEFLTMATQFLREAIPAVTQTPALLPLLSEMLMFGVRGFKAGRQLELAFEKLTEDIAETQKTPPPNPEMVKIEADNQARQQELQIRGQEAMSKGQVEMQRVRQEGMFRWEQLQIEHEKLALDERRLALEELKAQFEMQPEAVDEDARSIEFAKAAAEIEERKANIANRQRELSLQVAAHNKELVAESDAEPEEGAPQPSAIPMLSEQLAGALTKQAQVLAEHMSVLMQQAIERQDALVAQMSERQDRTLQQIAGMLSAPKRVVRDDAGRVVGVEVDRSMVQ